MAESSRRGGELSAHPENTPADEEKGQSFPAYLPADLDACPRCGEPLDEIRWGQTDCPRCGLHFECC